MSYRVEKIEEWDVIVIGGGAAGMMAAGRAAEKGARVLLLEKNERLGKKLSITGGGRCNITNGEPDARKWVAKLGAKGKFLLPAFARFGVSETLEFFRQRGLETKTEAEGRMFPKSDRAEDVCRTLEAYVRKQGVEVRFRTSVSGFEIQDGRIAGVKVKKETLRAKAYVLATGGKSRPETGSTGEGFEWLKRIGHTVIAPDPALVPIKVREKWVRDVQGVSFYDVRLSLYQDGKKRSSREGKLLFTHFGISGPVALNMSRETREYLNKGDVELSVDIMPAIDAAEADRRLLEALEKHQNKQVRNGLAEFLPAKLIPVVLRLADVDARKPANILTREERLRISSLLKDFRLHVTGFLGFEKAIVTGGGVALKEVDFRTMRSRLFPNLHIVGDVLDFNRPSGGYSLQICWTTGYLAGEHADIG